MSTFEMRGKEFHCLGCGSWWEWLQPTPIDPNENQGRHDELRARFDAGERGPL